MVMAVLWKLWRRGYVVEIQDLRRVAAEVKERATRRDAFLVQPYEGAKGALRVR